MRYFSMTRTTNMLPLTRRAGPPTFGPVDGHNETLSVAAMRVSNPDCL